MDLCGTYSSHQARGGKGTPQARLCSLHSSSTHHPPTIHSANTQNKPISIANAASVHREPSFTLCLFSGPITSRIISDGSQSTWFTMPRTRQNLPEQKNQTPSRFRVPMAPGKDVPAPIFPVISGTIADPIFRLMPPTVSQLRLPVYLQIRRITFFPSLTILSL
jgi:hypothetical protein